MGWCESIETLENRSTGYTINTIYISLQCSNKHTAFTQKLKSTQQSKKQKHQKTKQLIEPDSEMSHSILKLPNR